MLHLHHCMFLYNLGKSAAESKKMIDGVYWEGSFGTSTCREWFAKFKKGDFDLEDKPQNGRPQEFVREKLLAFLDNDPTQSTLKLAAKLGVVHSTIVRLLENMHKKIMI